MQKYLKTTPAVRDFQNLWKNIREVSKASGLDEMWSGPEKQLRTLLVEWGDVANPRDKQYVTRNLLYFQ